MSKFSQIQEWMNEYKIDVSFINNPHHIAYLTGFSSNPHERILALVITSSRILLFTPLLDVEEAKEFHTDVVGYADDENPWKKLANEFSDFRQDERTFAIENDYLTVERLNALQNEFESSTFEDNISPFLREMMLIKSPDEINKMKRAGELADFALEVGMKAIHEGVTESEIVAEIEYQLKKKGIREMSFDTLVLAGEHAASPHGMPGEKAINKNEFILFDLGVVYEGYTSDVSRTVAFGEIPSKHKEIYEIVLKAQEEAILAIQPGITAGELDAIARDIITQAGYGDYFTHRLGHGLGSSVHEFPSISKGNDFVIREGMCFSIEPGIYIPGEVGVRIEDCVVVTNNGCEVFTKTSKMLESI